MQYWPPRSYLFVPGSRPDRFDKACAAGADAVIIDLEDSVVDRDKVAARSMVASWLSPRQPVLLRINAEPTEWFREDLQLCSRAGVAGIVLPKADSPRTVVSVSESTAGAIPILPLIETGRGFSNALALAQTGRVQRLLFGSIDLQLDLGMDVEEQDLHYFRLQLVLVSRIAGIDSPVDGVTSVIDAPGVLRTDVLRARRLGFGGKLCIHPKQVGQVNECFSPSAEDIVWANKVLKETRAVGAGAVTVDGRMVDRPLIEKAKRIVRQSQRDALASGSATAANNSYTA